MPHTTEHTPKVLTRSVNNYARESSRKRQQHDRHTHTHRHTPTQRRFVQNLFSRRCEGCTYRTSQMRSYRELDFLHHANTSMGVRWDNTFFFSDSQLNSYNKTFWFQVQVHNSVTQGRWLGAQSGLVNVCKADKIKNLKKLHLWRSLSLTV